ncbi:thermostable hemolysin [Xenorhabdus cabanillasii]|uniref:Thermostable hemolysin n=1 Tax=Xenorhabdus cabanillasii TaxID=351673 RepID=A0A3D9UGM6_9GAMM|nr:thermostable hemolysin [Xenorhabdus cabanillasii]REF28602.1 thermostable hemolysin [Xenorhabdus cabanillasii]
MEEKYASFYNAYINPNPDYYMVASQELNNNSKVVSCAGISFKSQEPLFSEQYLNKSIEETINDIWGREYKPEKIAEIGGLISNNRNVSVKFTTLIPFIAYCAGANVLLCTITQTVVKLLSKCGIKFDAICSANKECLNENNSDWGTYYESNPVTGVIFFRRSHKYV